MQLSEKEKQLLLQLSRHTLENLYSDHYEKVVKDFASEPGHLTPTLLENLPCFVTLNEDDGRLRGCIGTLTTYNSLYKNVFYFTRQAALSDPRFDPVIEPEVPNLKIHISVLGPLHPLTSLKHLKLGTQGLVVSQGHRRGVLLATVATDQGWDAQEFLDQTCHKAGLDPVQVAKYDVEYFDQIEFGEH